MDLPQDCLLSITVDGIVILDRTSKEILKSFSFNDIIRWGVSETMISFDVGTIVRNDQYCFELEKYRESVIKRL